MTNKYLVNDESERLDKLPVWAKDMVSRLCNDLAYRDTMIAEMAEVTTDTKIVSHPYGNTPLGVSGRSVKFLEENITVSIIEDGGIKIMATRGTIAVAPVSSNVIEITRK